MNIHVTNLDINLIESDLQRVFAPYGEVEIINIDRDQWNNRSRGKAMVGMPVASEAKDAVQHLDGAMLGKKKIALSIQNDLDISSFKY